MRHRVKGKKLGRDAAHRKALLKNLSESLILHESITTTLPKAKYVRPFIEKLVTKAKKGTGFANIREIKKHLVTEEAVKKLVTSIAPVFAKRNGGYTRIVRVGERGGDNAPMARIEFVEDIPKKKAKKTATKVKEEKKQDEK